MKTLDKTSFSYIMGELTHVCPFPVGDREFFKLQIRSDDGRSTKWLNITPEQFKKLENILLQIEG